MADSKGKTPKTIQPARESAVKKGGNGYPAPKCKPMRGERTAKHMKKASGRGR